MAQVVSDAEYYISQIQRQLDGYELGAASMEQQMDKLIEENNRYRRLCRGLVAGGFLADDAYSDHWPLLAAAAPGEIPKCCAGTGFADYASVPCSSPKCPVVRR